MPPYEYKPNSQDSLLTAPTAINAKMSRGIATRSATVPTATQQLPPRREVGAGMVNLGNTCYMNCVLEVLAHAPELCLSLDIEPHRVQCPTAQAKARKRRASPSPDDSSASNSPAKATRKSRRSNGGKRSPNGDSASPNSDEDDASAKEASDDFCALCEVEQLLEQVHASQTDAVAPSDFVNGFIDHVAPWFKLGVQEDSHEFLRLLIDAMQKSCAKARPENKKSPEDEDNKDQEQAETEYPFKLFRGTIESNVVCDACKASSAKIDPIEDIGLEVRSARSTTGDKSLANVSSAFQRFVHAEPLDAYKCEKCGKLGRATKQSRLASIPPILTLHLKRFRYGSDGPHAAKTTVRGGRSELGQLLSSQQPSDLMAAFGKSGSAKIEGHVQFEQVLDLKPFLTPELQERHKALLTRLFAVIVHAGKNSHSGHYISYVRNIHKNEWWKFDDARVTKVLFDEVMNAEAYMLFYRAMDHPVAVQLRDAYKIKLEQQAAQQKEEEEKKKLQEQQQKQEEEAASVVKATAPVVLPESPSIKLEGRKRKRGTPDYECAEDWANDKTNLSTEQVSLLRRVEEFLSESIEFKAEVSNRIKDEASKGRNGPSSVCVDDIQGGPERYRPGVMEFLFQMCASKSKEGVVSLFKTLTAPPADRKNEPVAEKTNETAEAARICPKDDKSSRGLVIPPPVMDSADAVI